MEPYNYGPRRRSVSPDEDEDGTGRRAVPQFPQSPGEGGPPRIYQQPVAGSPHPTHSQWQYGAHTAPHGQGPPPDGMPVPHSPLAAGGSPGSTFGGFAPPPGPPPGFPYAGPNTVQNGTGGTSPSFPHDASRGPPSLPLHRPPSSAHSPPPHSPPSPPPGYTAHAPPPSGYRIPLTTTAPFPAPAQALAPVGTDADGHSPVYLGSAIMHNSVHPCKVAPHLAPTPVRVPYGGTEHEHQGRYDLLPFDGALMQWVPTNHGRIPEGRRAVEGGYEDHGAKLYHALATINGVAVPGKAGVHLNGCNVAFGGAEHIVTTGYSILCWK